MPRQSKSVDSRQRRNEPDVVDLRLLDGGLRVPPPPDGASGLLVAAWEAFWASDLAGIVSAIDLPAIGRLFWLYGQEEWLRVEVEDRPMVEGSTGQPRRNPLWDQLNVVTAQIKDLEDRFGLNPKGRLALGVALNQVKRGLADLTAELEVEA